jgi:FtsP/CotA-like multicopper oxidase with cupredoxin domain
MTAFRPSRRSLLASGAAGAASLLLGAACAPSDRRPVRSDSPQVREVESRRRPRGARVRDVALVAAVTDVDLGGRTVAAWTYGGRLPGPLLRVTAGEVLRVRLRNDLPEDTSVHWHGVALRNDMDGVPHLTQDPIGPRSEFTYEFTVPDPGTYFFHPHTRTQLDRGLYAPLIVDDPSDPGHYDTEAVVVLDDWPEEEPDGILARLREGMAGPGGHGMHAGMGARSMVGPGSSILGGDAGDVAYPLYLLNGRRAEDSGTIRARPGQRMRLRLINAGADTAFRVALGGHRFTVTHTDGFPVRPVIVDTLLLGMGERYDVEMRLEDGVFPLVAVAEGKRGQAFGLVRTSSGEPPHPEVRPAELSRRLLSLADLRATDGMMLETGRVDRTHDVILEGSMMTYRWTINGRSSPDAKPLWVRQGQTVRLRLRNRSMMWHPMHLHGHTFQVRRPDGTAGARKDTVGVLPGRRVEADLVAANPGRWALHCHNIYHAEAGMMTALDYEL